MSTRFRGQPPRVLLHTRDHATGSYPSIVRTGSGKNRLGTNKIFYDDNKTPTFINYPFLIAGTFTTIDPAITNFHQSEEYSGSLVAYWNFDEDSSTITVNAPEFAIFHPDLYTGSLDLTSSRKDPLGNIFTKDTPRDLDVNNSIDYQYELLPSTNGFPSNYYKSWVTGSGVDNFSFGDGTTDNPFSVSLWFKRNLVMDFADDISGLLQAPVRIPRQCLISKSGSIGQEWVIRLEQGVTEEAGLRVLIWDNTNQTYIGKFFRNTGIFPNYRGPTLGVWKHLGVSYDGSGSELGISASLDGVNFNEAALLTSGTYVAMSGTGQALVVGAADNLFLSGAATSSHEEPCGSNIADVAIFNRVLTRHDFRKISAVKRGISLPSGLPNGHPFLTDDLKTTMILDSNFKKQNISEFLQIPSRLFDARTNILSPLESLELKPFNEDFRPEQSVETDFFLTGSKASETTLGFSSKLGSKISLSRKFKIKSNVIVTSGTASLYYFNPISGSYRDAVPVAERQDTGNTTINAWFHDAKLFSPFGTFCLTGALNYQTRFSKLHEYLFKEDSFGEEEDVAQLLSLGHENHLLLNTSYAPSDDGLTPDFFVIDDIEHSFLLEKAVVELPFSASSDWMDDQTIITMSDAIGVAGEDIGGPAITVALLRNNPINNTRELICSGTIIPSGDNTSFARTTNFQQQKTPAGFLSFGTPNVVLQPDANGSFVGKVRLNMTPAITNGFIKRGIIGGTSDTLKQLAPFGRSGDTKFVGRSFFGKEFSTDVLDSSKNIHYDLPELSSSTNNVFIGSKDSISPYILEKNDQIMLVISKFRPAINEGTVASSREILVTTHTIEFPMGEINIRLYGSNIRNCQENNNDFLNQGLTSLAIHEDVHGHNPITDQLDICPITDLTGTYVDHYITGTTDLLPPISSSNTTFINEFNNDMGEGAYTARVRGVVRSALSTNIGNKTYTTSNFGTDVTRRYWINHMIRNITLQTDNVRFLDTLMPKFDDIYKKQISGGDVLFDVGGFAEYAFSENPDSSEVRDWLYQFPYEPTHSEIPRLTNFSKNIKAVDAGSAEGQIVSEVQVEHGEIELWDRPQHNISSAGTIKVPSTDRELLSAVFGFHNHFGLPKFSNDYSNRAPLLLGKCELGQKVQVRGFKYGINHIGALGPRYTFRRDRFGQMRDMLEQGLNTAVYSDKRSQFTSPPVRATFAKTDQSSNLSTFCTSSLPFFDGISRNTPEPDEEPEF